MAARLKKVQARFYETTAGAKPLRDWILSLPVDDRKRIGKDIQKVEFGWPIGMPYCRPLGQGLWEVRSDLSDGAIGRVIFFFREGAIVLLHGFMKKTRKTPSQDIALALRRMKEVRG
jgi:phage-related protein